MTLSEQHIQNDPGYDPDDMQFKDGCEQNLTYIINFMTSPWWILHGSGHATKLSLADDNLYMAPWGYSVVKL